MEQIRQSTVNRANAQSATSAARVQRVSTRGSQTAQRLIDAAREIIAERGVSGLTVEAITRRAGVNKAAISYHFGGKAGLVALVVDATVKEMMLGAVRTSEKLRTVGDRLAFLIAGEQRIAENDEAYRAWFGVFPLAYGDPKVREQICAAYDWYIGVLRECLGPLHGISDSQKEALARLITAVTDGLAAQRAMAGGKVDLTEPFRLFRRMIALVLHELEGAQGVR